MYSAYLPSPVGDQQLRSALNAAVRESLCPLTAALGVVYGVHGVAHFFFGPEAHATALMASMVTTAAILACIRIGVGRWVVADRFLYPLLFGVAVLVIVNCVSLMCLVGDARETGNFALLILGLGLISLSAGWSALVVAVTWVSWFGVVASVDLSGDWRRYGVYLVWATVLGAVAQTVRQTLLGRLLRAEAKHRLLIEHLPLASYVADIRPTGAVIYISPQIERLLGYKPEEWLRRKNFWVGCLYAPDKERTLAAFQNHVRTQTPWDLEYRMVAKDGRVVWLNDRSTRIVDDGRQPLAYGILVDITERKRGEALRHGGHRVLEQLAASAPLPEVLEVLVRVIEEVDSGKLGAVMLVDGQNRLRPAAAPNLPAAFRSAIDGMRIGPGAAACGAAVHLGQLVIVDDIDTHSGWAEYRDAARQAGLRACWSLPIASRTGRVLGTLAMYYQNPGVPRNIDRQLMESESRLAALAIERAQGEEEMQRYREHLEELVAARTRQLQTSLDQLRHSERLASVGTLAAGIAHEINNPVGMILLSAEQALAHSTEQDREHGVDRYLRDIVGNAKRCGQIVKNVLRFARHEPAERWSADINNVVQRAVELTRAYATRRGGAIETRLCPDLPAIVLNPLEIEQVFVNLIRNGIEAADEAPRIKIASEMVRSVVRITVGDNGRGVSPDDRSRIFDPFFTTRRGSEGAGLGLSVSYGIVTDHGGTIRVESAPGGGTIMVVELLGSATSEPDEEDTVSAHRPAHRATSAP
jgi:two-component system, cell cycle sensor histidine kinase and response regulator CckA